jgi:hypothetical protein
MKSVRLKDASEAQIIEELEARYMQLTSVTELTLDGARQLIAAHLGEAKRHKAKAEEIARVHNIEIKENAND